MIEIELFDGTVLEFPQGTSQEIIDRVARQETAARQTQAPNAMADRIAAARAGTLTVSPESAARTEAANQQATAMMQPERTLGQTIYENVIGSGEVDTPGERLGELVRGVGAGAVRGATELVGLPGTIGGLMDVGAQRLGLLREDAPESAVMSALSGEGLRSGLSAITGGETEYRAPGVAGDYASTIGEFLPGAMGGGLGTALRYGVAPAVASEAAGQATEGTAFEPYARTAAALGTSILASRPGAFVGDDEAARMANVIRDAGVDVTAGQARQSPTLMRMEGMLQATDEQLQDFTAATLRQLGSNAKAATPTNLTQIEKSIVNQMDDAVRGVNIIPNATQAQAAADVAADYVSRVPAGQLTPRVRGIANEIKALAATGKDVPLSRLKTWRSDIGALTISPDAATRESAHALRRLLDDMTDTALIAAGREGDIAALAQARESYRNYIGVRDAASRAGAEGGILSPTALNQSMIRAQGREAYATGRSTPMTDFTRSGAATLRSAPTVLPGGVRSIAEALPAALAASVGFGAFGAGVSPVLAGLAAGGAALSPAIGQMAMRSAPAQAMLRNPLGTLTQAGRTIPGLLAQ
jgi:hypothetical protein